MTATPPSAPSPPSAPPTPPAAKRLIRRTDDRIIAGVASGVADYLGLDPVLVRVGFVVLAFAGGTGVIAYLALWLLTPEGIPGHPVAPANPDRGAAFWVAIALFVLAGLAIADAVFDRSIVWPLVLVGAGIALWRSDTQRLAAPAAPPTSSSMTPPPAGTIMTADTHDRPATAAAPTDPTTPIPPAAHPPWTPPPAPGRAVPPTAPAPTPPSSWEPPEPRDRSILGRLTVALTLIAIGIGAILDQADVLDFTVQYAFATALLILGIGLIVGTWVGRARWLAVVGALVVLPGLLLTSVAGDLNLNIGDGIGERRFDLGVNEQVAAEYRHGIGDLTVDLSDVDFSGETVDATVDLGIGQATVYVPQDVALEITANVAAGEINVLGQQANGTSVSRTVNDPGVEGAGRLRLDVEVTFGEIQVVRR